MGFRLQDAVMNLARNLKVECVSHLNPAPPLQVSPGQSVGEAVALMRREGVGCVLVCQGNALLGIFTERDLMRRVLATGKPLTVPVSQCMTPNPEVVRAREPIAAAIRRMEEGGYRHLPVVNEEGQPVGMLSVKRIMQYLAEHFSATIYNQPPDPGAVPKAPEGA
jgi:CBS domain-containing protein